MNLLLYFGSYKKSNTFVNHYKSIIVASKKNKAIYSEILLGILIGIGLITVLSFSDTISDMFNFFSHKDKNITVIISKGKEPTKLFGYDMDKYFFETDKVKPNQILGSILYWEGVPYYKIDELAKKSVDIFDVRMIRVNKNFTIVKNDSCGQVISLVYEPDQMSYVVFNIADSVYVKKYIRPVETRLEFAEGEVVTSLWNSMRENKLSISLIDKMEDALASEVDFYHAQKGDRYKLLFERKYINNKPVSIGKLLGAYYKNDKEHYGLYFESDKYKGYYNLDGHPSKKAFLRAPVRFSRISSRFSYHRFHPILHKTKAHFGTDYAAAYGTPIMAVAAGTIVRKGYGRGNGNFITIRHDKTYTTTYLHMQRFAKGIKKGVHVAQGQIIGYVGSTGLATGPHVCFRMKKHGKPIDHLRENFPSPEPLPDSVINKYFVQRDSILRVFNNMEKKFIKQNELANYGSTAKYATDDL